MKNSVKMVLEASPKFDEKLNRLAVATGTSPEQVLLKAITLYEVASDAKHKNQHLSILDTNQHVVAEVVGV
ncbi:hypothetical protein [Massilia sp.]|uniref:hypothetical protein n=1 Tax=Massilia sp. TaxID=1882437 RepID=UPI00352CC6B8